MDKISVLVICAIFSAIFYASVEGQNIVAPGCCPGGAGGFAVLAPPPVYVECHSPERDDSRVDPAFTGYGYQAGGCPNVAACAPGVLTCTPGHVVSRTLFAPSSFSYQAGCGGSGIYQRTWCGDNCFGAPLCSGQQQITVRDTTPPVLGVPGTANLECGLNDYSPNQERTESGFANWYDHCTLHSSFQPSISDSAPAALCGSGTGIITRTYSLTDLCLHTTTDVQIINIVDTIPPILRGVFDEIVEAGVNSAVSNPTAEDLCTNVPTITRTNFQYPGRCQAESTTERVYVVSDSCGNSRRYSSILTVQDTLPPTCTDSGSPVTSQDFFVLCTAFPPAPSAAIACSDASGLAVVVTRDDYETFQLLDPDNDESREALDRTLVRNYTATDTCGNTLNWVYRYHIQQVSTITYVTGASVTILPGKTGTVTFSFNVGSCPLRGARLHYDVYPLVLTGTGSAGCLEINGGRQVVGDSYCVIPTPSALGAFTFNVGVYVPFTFEEDKLTIRFEVTALNQLDLSAGTYGEVTVHTA